MIGIKPGATGPPPRFASHLMQVNARARRRCDGVATGIAGAERAMHVLLDLRHLPPPEPMQRILDALDALPARACLHALTPHRPEPLLPMLERLGYAWRIDGLDEGGARIAICRLEDAAMLPADPPAPR